MALDFGDRTDRQRLHRILERADIVVESARPRALAQLGVDVEALVKDIPGLTWVSVTGYGRRQPGAGWVAFGDDAGVAAGLAAATGVAGGPPLFCGDAVADPLTGLHAALAALACWRGGGGYLLDLALRDVAAHVLAFGPAPSAARVQRAGSGWEVVAADQRTPVSPPRARPVRRPARPLGADTESILEELALSC
jgi:crotonobetainyl-CoA:carnitine CoA-transferase CaiB-like acyl-CoA transferase